MVFANGGSGGLIEVRRPVRVAFFAGSDITTHLVLNRLAPVLLDSGISVTLYLTRGKTSPKRPRVLQQLFFAEHTLLQDHVYPYLDRHGVARPYGFTTPEGWQRIAPQGMRVAHVADVNDPEFVTSLADQGISVAVSVRCYQKFRPPILTALGGPESGSVFANLHPGLLPGYRGVNTFLRAMQHDEVRTGYTLHHLEPDWDTGAIIGQRSFVIDYSQSALGNMMAHVADAAGVILDLIRAVAGEKPVPGMPQDHSAARYFSYPTESELEQMADRGVHPFRAEAVLDTLTDVLFGAVPDVEDLREVLHRALAAAGIETPQPIRVGAYRAETSAAVEPCWP
jgi:hypothetical protein